MNKELKEKIGCGKIERTPSGFGIACGEFVGMNQFLCSKCQAKEEEKLNEEIQNDFYIRGFADGQEEGKEKQEVCEDTGEKS